MPRMLSGLIVQLCSTRSVVRKPTHGCGQTRGSFASRTRTRWYFRQPGHCAYSRCADIYTPAQPVAEARPSDGRRAFEGALVFCPLRGDLAAESCDRDPPRRPVHLETSLDSFQSLLGLPEALSVRAMRRKGPLSLRHWARRTRSCNAPFF